MRISGGSLKGRTFYPPADHWPTRPTTDFSRTALFNILTNMLDFEEVKMLDLFGGTGAHGYEMISRGCKNVTYVDKFKPAIKFVTEKAELWKIQDNIKLVHADYLVYIQQCNESFDYIFAGPPYELNKIDEIPDRIFEYQLLKEDGLFVLEHNPHYDYQSHEFFWKQRNYGQTHFSFFKINKEQ